MVRTLVEPGHTMIDSPQARTKQRMHASSQYLRRGIILSIFLRHRRERSFYCERENRFRRTHVSSRNARGFAHIRRRIRELGGFRTANFWYFGGGGTMRKEKKKNKKIYIIFFNL